MKSDLFFNLFSISFYIYTFCFLCYLIESLKVQKKKKEKWNSLFRRDDVLNIFFDIFVTSRVKIWQLHICIKFDIKKEKCRMRMKNLFKESGLFYKSFYHIVFLEISKLFVILPNGLYTNKEPFHCTTS